MLNLESKYLIVFSLIILLISCENKEKINSKKYKEVSINQIGEKQYNEIKNQINDSVKNWIKNDIIYYGAFQFENTIIVDTLLCLNKTQNKLVSAKLTRHIGEKDNSDGITFFYGAKINNQWYFFRGAFIVLPREMYQKDVTKPLSFEKLHEIALKEVFRGYLKEKERPFWEFWKPKEYEVNEQFFNQMESKNIDGTYGCCCKTFEDMVLEMVKSNWNGKQMACCKCN
jgi:hypothetical protein